MNRLSLLHSLFWIAISVAAPVWASTDGVNTRPFQFPEGDAAWSVTLKKGDFPSDNSPAESASGPRDIKSIDVVRMGGLRRDARHWTDGSTTQCWIISTPPLALMENANGGPIQVMKLTHLHGHQFDESNFSFVGPSTFAGIKELNGKKCRYYETHVEVAAGEKQLIRAWIDDASSQPAAWSDGIVSAIFSFDAPLPKEPLILPANFEKEVARYKAYYAPPK